MGIVPQNAIKKGNEEGRKSLFQKQKGRREEARISLAVKGKKMGRKGPWQGSRLLREQDNN